MLPTPERKRTMMLLSFALIFLCGLTFAAILEKFRLTRLLGMLAAGMLLGPYALNWIDGSVLGISAQIRLIALVVIMLRAGLSLNINDLKKVGRPALLMCCVPAVFEILGFVAIGPPLLHISVLDAAMIGCILAAVSPAVIIPKMLKIMEVGYGVKQGIPQMILAGASVDDVFVIVLFTGFTNLAQTGEFSALALLQIPISIAFGVALGAAVGFALAKFFQKIAVNDLVKVIVLLCVSFLFTALETFLKDKPVTFAAMLAVIAMGVALLKVNAPTAKAVQPKFAQLWGFAEVLLFVLVGAMIDFTYAADYGLVCILAVLGALVFRMAGVWVCMLKTSLNNKERLFCMIAYIPKATVQAAIGGIPLAMGLPCGMLAVTAAVLAIIATAPAGAFGIELTYQKLLTKDEMP